MDTARLFQSGRSQAVRLPKKYRFSGEQVAVRHFGNGVLLLPLEAPWAILDAALNSFEHGFQISRDQPAPQLREGIKPEPKGQSIRARVICWLAARRGRAHRAWQPHHSGTAARP